MVFLKCIPNYHGKLDNVDGYDHNCSTMTDMMVIICYMLKFTQSQATNYHDLEGILNDNYNDAGEEQYVEMVYYANQYQDQY